MIVIRPLLHQAKREIMAKFRKRDFLTKLLGTSFAIAISLLLHHFSFYSIEALGYDLLFRLKTNAANHQSPITNIAIDRQTLKNLGHDPQFNDYAQFLNILNKYEPKGVLFLIDPNKVNGPKSKFAQESKKTPNLIFSIEKLFITGREQEFLMSYPLEHLNIVSGNISADAKNFAGDGVSRRAIISYENRAFAQTQMAQIYTGPQIFSQYKGAFPFKGSYQTLTHMSRPGSFKEYSFHQIITSKDLKEEDFKDRIIIVGFKTNSEAKNYVKTVYSRDIVAMSKLEYTANIIYTLITDSGIAKAPYIFSLLLTIFVSILTLYFAFLLRPVTGITGILVLLSSVLLFNIVLFAGANTYLDFMHSVAAAVICYYFIIPYRLIMEHRKSWEYQQKNKLLTQVEELKTNFISMMSHDLKTPLARIQGMADLALRDKNSVSTNQKNAINSISKSTDELTHFIDSVLNLSRVESQGIKLQLSAKDINKIIEKAIARYKDFATEKSIEIVTELEPLFSIKIDPHLIQQVIGNLVENAIKYSRESSKVLISTEEVDGEIIIQVADQGKGIPRSELENIFMKFYRSKDVKTSSIKGSGLGLYLSSYFVKLHNGKINVESEVDQGSTFTVQLPTNL